MEKVKVNRDDLIEKLKLNLVVHQEEYEEAHAGWKVAVLARIKKLERDFKANAEAPSWKNFSDLDEPENHSPDYKRAITMLSWSEDTVIFLSEEDVSSYILDEWDWKARHLLSTSNYSNH